MPICFLSKKLIGNLLKPGLSPSTSTFQQHNSGKFWVTTVWRCIPTNSKPVSNAVRDVCDRWMPIFAAIEYFYQQQRLSQNLKYIRDPGQSFQFRIREKKSESAWFGAAWHVASEKWKMKNIDQKVSEKSVNSSKLWQFLFFPKFFVHFRFISRSRKC